MRSKKAILSVVAVGIAAVCAVVITSVSLQSLSVPADDEIVRIQAPGQGALPGAIIEAPAPPPAAAAEAAAAPPPADIVRPKLAAPLPDPVRRITKKPFGIYIRPEDSPVSPERFRGYHTGVDLETFAAEQDVDVEVAAVCDGPLLVKRTAGGYGGVAVQSCRIDDRGVTVVYGHLRLASIEAAVGDRLAAGQRLGLLGTGFGPETDGERRHLHLSVHIGDDVNIRGYVPDRSALDQWLDPAAVGGWN